MRILDDGPADAGAHEFAVELQPDDAQARERWVSAADRGEHGVPHATVRCEGGKRSSRRRCGPPWSGSTRRRTTASAGPRRRWRLFDYLAGLPREAEPGTRFNYNTGETNLVGSLLRAAIGNNASTYLTENVETGGCCIHATLRDYARIGLFALRGGVLPDGTRVLPEGWMLESTTPSAGSPQYGYLWWLWEEGTYSANGIFGQMIWIDPKAKVVIVTHSAWPAATGGELSEHRSALTNALYRRALAVD